MKGGVRMAFGVAAVALATGPLALAQALANATGRGGRSNAPRLWHRTILKALGIRVHVEGHLADGRPLLIVSNHVSWTDIMVVGASANVNFIARADMADWPILGRLAKIQRVIFVERARRHASGAQMDALAERLRAGDPVVLFAEGTTGDGNRLLPFKSTLFGAAGRAIGELPDERVLVQPVAVVYTRVQGIVMGRRERADLAWIGDMDLVPHIRSLFARGRIDVELRYGEPIVFARDGDRKVVARAAEEQVRAMMAAAWRGEPHAP